MIYLFIYFLTASLLTPDNIVLVYFWQYGFMDNFHQAGNSALDQLLLTTKVKTANRSTYKNGFFHHPLFRAVRFDIVNNSNATASTAKPSLAKLLSDC